ncbi:putative aldo/keto reductase [Leptomonas seymouri]|uniref:Putative aldo/keto reductase n=1 Tax=Leptomonas seymouri TaxID=5684 RepID=A0A0N0P4R8_LEPSE|nr:putative aldo/keto reductase [Leptomonas seymouri]|eukprot:KPI85137.1 putative aldo/keto reductase [Leptomonas seymouri]
MQLRPAMAATLPLLRFGMPPIGIGTYELRGDDCVQAVRAALQMGYRLIDTAAGYHNEDLVGEGITTSGVAREEMFVIVKIAPKSMGTDEGVRRGILESIRKLRIHYADCVLMHWPGCGGLKPGDAAGHRAARSRCWRVMTALQQEGKVRFLGVSNFLPRHFEQLSCFADDPTGSGTNDANGAPAARESAQAHAASQSSSSTLYALPAVNQVELHPLCVQRDVDEYCRGKHEMVLQQYSPLAKGDARLLQHPKLLEFHTRYFAAKASHVDGGKERGPEEERADTSHTYSVHDVVLMWGLAQGYCTLVRSHYVEHLRANLAAAQDYFASMQEASLDGGTERTRTRPLLTASQVDAIHSLRRHMGVEDTADLHVCWYSSEIL